MQKGIEEWLCGTQQEKGDVDTFDEKSHSERDFFQYIETAYRAFLEGDDERCQELDDEKAREIEERTKSISERNKQLEEVSY